MKKPLELYVHIPFCVKKCAYCDFLSGPAGEEEKEAYVKMLEEEIRSCPERVKEYEVVSVFFGGGTPSLLTGEQIGRIMKAIRDTFCMQEMAEITMEMNPGTVKEDALVLYKEAGVNRLSIGLQSVHNEELKMLGRIHTYEEFLHSYRMARNCGFQNINIDLISAIPGQTEESWRKTLEQVIDLGPEHISAYSLILEPGTVFYEKYADGKKSEGPGLPDEDAERQMYWDTGRIMSEHGYQRYEISNYAKKGFACRHNLGYWDRAPYLGFGVGAASCVPGEWIDSGDEENAHRGKMGRYTNPDKISDYKKCYQEKFHAQILTVEEEMEEFMFLGLRKTEGVWKEAFFTYFGKQIEEIYDKPLKKLEELRLLEQDEKRIWLTGRGLDVSNAVFVEFLLEE